MTPLRQRMINDMTVRGLAENTKKSYLNSVTGLARPRLVRGLPRTLALPSHLRRSSVVV